MRDYNADLKKYFPTCGYEKLHETQKHAISNVVEKGSTLCIMPTGKGKSLIYWMSAIELGGMCLVVSPLNALIAEQAEKIKAYGYDVLVFNSTVSNKEQLGALIQIANGKRTPDFIFASPEKIATDGFFEYCLKKRSEDLRLLVLDEVHCVSQWGISFRPFYKNIPDFLNRIFETSDKWCRILALTATLNPKELNDICNYFNIAKENIIKENILMRSEIQLHVNKFDNEDEKEDYFWNLIKTHANEKILVYVYRKYKKRSVEDLCKKAVNDGYKAACFHADMNYDERMKILSDYKNGNINLIFATNAFGMGIDISDVRVVIHFMIPESVEQYYQEIGRAARDGKGANAYLLYSDKNIDVKRTYFIDNSFPDKNILINTYKKITPNKSEYNTIQYFEDTDIQKCLSYYTLCGAVEIAGKGFPNLKFINDINDPTIQKYFDSTKTRGYVATLTKNSLTPDELSNSIYEAIVNGTVSVSDLPPRWIVLKVNATELDDSLLDVISDYIDEKKTYKYALLDYLVELLNKNLDSIHLHQEIARYLGADTHYLNCIYTTLDKNKVRSKSEVIISDLLYKAEIDYKYEEKLYYESDKYIEPDFTIHYGDKTYYWEHLGMLGQEDYSKRWFEKNKIYNKYFPGQLIKTYESGTLSSDAESLINKIINGEI